VPRAQGIAVVCTSVPAAAVIQQVEEETRLPVVNTLAATVRRTLHLAGKPGCRGRSPTPSISRSASIRITGC
jgi:maleate cis-trans isomerase